MPPAFNLSQDQTLQFNACYCFSVQLRTGRSLNVLTDPAYLSILKTYLNTSVRLDTFASNQIRKSGPTSLSSAHTYRLLVFKEHSQNLAPILVARTASAYRLRTSFFASLHLQQRNEIMKNVSLIVNKFF